MYRVLLSIACIVTFGFVLLAWDDADAARFGGRRSFGGKSFMSKPFTKSVPQAMPSMSQQGGKAGIAGAGAAATGAAGSRFGGMGGMFGGLLAGTLIGSMLFGGGFQGSGMMDILLIAGLLFLGFKLLGRFRASKNTNRDLEDSRNSAYNANPQAAGAGASFGGQDARESNTNFSGSSAWDALKSGSSGQGGRGSGQSQDSQIRAPQQDNPEPFHHNAVSTPEDFDSKDFLHGAKLTYTRLNASWDKRDLDDIAQFSSPAFMETIKEQAAESPEPGRTDVLLVDATLVGFETKDNEQIVSVYFSVLLRESDDKTAGSTPIDLREVWHFTRAIAGNERWVLDGIQQVEKP